MQFKYKELSERILEAAFEVSNELGAGFLESVYKNALRIALQQKGFGVATEFPLQVTFRGEIIGKYFADIIVEDKIIIELKATEQLYPEHSAQVINYLKATGIEVGLLLNFGKPRLQYKRLENIKDQS